MEGKLDLGCRFSQQTDGIAIVKPVPRRALQSLESFTPILVDSLLGSLLC